MKNYILLSFILIISGCSIESMMVADIKDYQEGDFGYIETSHSLLDNTKTVRLNPMVIYNHTGPYLMLGAKKTDNTWVIIASNPKPTVWKASRNLVLKIDNESLELEPTDKNNYGYDAYYGFNGYLSSYTDKYFKASREILEKIANAKSGVVRAYESQGYIEGAITPHAYPKMKMHINNPEIQFQTRLKEFLKATVGTPALANEKNL